MVAEIPATKNPDSMAQNLKAMGGVLTDKAMRPRMMKPMESLPGFDKLAQMPLYPDKQFAGLVSLPGLAATKNSRSAKNT